MDLEAFQEFSEEYMPEWVEVIKAGPLFTDENGFEHRTDQVITSTRCRIVDAAGSERDRGGGLGPRERLQAIAILPLGTPVDSKCRLRMRDGTEWYVNAVPYRSYLPHVEAIVSQSR